MPANKVSCCPALRQIGACALAASLLAACRAAPSASHADPAARIQCLPGLGVGFASARGTLEERLAFSARPEIQLTRYLELVGSGGESLAYRLVIPSGSVRLRIDGSGRVYATDGDGQEASIGQIVVWRLPTFRSDRVMSLAEESVVPARFQEQVLAAPAAFQIVGSLAAGYRLIPSKN